MIIQPQEKYEPKEVGLKPKYERNPTTGKKVRIGFTRSKKAYSYRDCVICRRPLFYRRTDMNICRECAHENRDSVSEYSEYWDDTPTYVEREYEDDYSEKSLGPLGDKQHDK